MKLLRFMPKVSCRRHIVTLEPKYFQLGHNYVYLHVIPHTKCIYLQCISLVILIKSKVRKIAFLYFVFYKKDPNSSCFSESITMFDHGMLKWLSLLFLSRNFSRHIQC
jgi:hypothetical protein